MFRYRLILILTILWVAFTLNLERPDNIFYIGNINIATFVYILEAGILLIIFVFPAAVDFPLRVFLFPLLAMYAFGRSLTFNSSISGETLPYLIIAELLILRGTLWVSRELSSSINQFNSSIEKAFWRTSEMSNSNIEDNVDVVYQRLDISRRFERNLIFLYVNLSDLDLFSNYQWNAATRIRRAYGRLQISELLGYVLQSNDLACWEGEDIVICLSQVPMEDAQKAAEQVESLLRDVLGIQTQVGVSHFPNDALIYEDLIQISRQRSKTLLKAPG